MEFLVGTFRHPYIFTLRFSPPSTLSIIHTSSAAGGHSWLTLSPDHQTLYTTCWTAPPQLASYRIDPISHIPTLLNTVPVASLSGYVCATATHLYSVGGPSGEVFALNPEDKSIGPLVQRLSFRSKEELHDGERVGVAHGSFGGLRHGSHSVDSSADGRWVFVADIGHNCIWTYAVRDVSPPDASGSSTTDGKSEMGVVEPLGFRLKTIAQSSGDGPRHTWPHPSGKLLYCLNEHSCTVAVYAVVTSSSSSSAAIQLEHKQSVKIIPESDDPGLYWADEVRVSRTRSPRFMYASTRGLAKETKGWVAAFEIDEDGFVVEGGVRDLYRTATSGGLANAVEPAPVQEGHEGEEEYMALTDSEEGFVFILGFDGKKLREVARVKLEGEEGEVLGAATAIWL